MRPQRSALGDSRMNLGVMWCPAQLEDRMGSSAAALSRCRVFGHAMCWMGGKFTGSPCESSEEQTLANLPSYASRSAGAVEAAFLRDTKSP